MDKYLLEYEIKKNGFSIDYVCKYLGISRSTWWKKTNCITEFTRLEIENLIELLNLTSPMDIFFKKEVS